ncbi:MAG: NTPase [candidate division WOR-3 bacterium]
MKILITGKPGSGKTTLLKRIYEELKNYVKVRGFFTGEIREKSERIGFFIENFEGKRKIFAHKDFDFPLKVSKYGVNINALLKIGLPEIIKAIEEKSFLMIDEIGKMELLSENFQELVEKAFNSGIDIIATISISPHPFIKEIKKREDVKIFEINENKREYIFKRIKEICFAELKI